MRPSSDRYRVTHLYDNVADPHQRRNLANDPAHARRRAELVARLLDRVAQVEGTRPQVATG